MDPLLQWIGGVFYLLNKVFFSLSERADNRGDVERKRLWRIASWEVYLVGLPAWVIIFMDERNRNWIAASVEASGAPAMFFGLVLAIRGIKKGAPKWLDRLALVCIPLGFGYSLYDFGGFSALTQWLETALVAGFLIGTYLLAKERAFGYLWYVLMHISCGWLMWIQGYPWLFVQQVISLGFILDAYLMTQKRKTALSPQMELPVV